MNKVFGGFMSKFKSEIKKLDIPIMVVPFTLIFLICLFLFLRPNETNAFISAIKEFSCAFKSGIRLTGEIPTATRMLSSILSSSR